MKRVFDVCVAGLLLLLMLPVMLCVSVTVGLYVGHPVIFKQQRAGFKGRPFTIYKFKTMNDKRDENGELLEDEFRRNRVGDLIRLMSLDELPQLVNVLKGDMSIVGPRPLLTTYLPLYSAEQMTRHNVKPGITGLAQVKGRNALSWQEKFNLDVYYVHHQSFLLDVKIIILTLYKVIKNDGVTKSDGKMMTYFKGN